MLSLFVCLFFFGPRGGGGGRVTLGHSLIRLSGKKIKPRCPSIDLTLQVLCFSHPTLRRNICTHLMFEYEIQIFEPQIERNFQCMTLKVISASSVVARKA